MSAKGALASLLLILWTDVALASPECKFSITRYDQRVVKSLGQSNGTIRIEAESACAHHIGGVYRLSRLKITVFDGTEALNLSADSGTFSKQQGVIITGPFTTTMGSDRRSWKTGSSAPLLKLDLNAGKMLASGLPEFVVFRSK